MDHAERIVVAMSGGVDSSASALLLSEQGYDVVGIAMQVWDYRKNHGQTGNSHKKATCCAPADFDDARTVAAKRGFPFYVFDFEESFYDAVIAPFVKSYLSGKTPNPCLECNRKVKFRELRRRAGALGVSKVATGHYAQIKPLPDGSVGLFTAVDRSKDQSYFLYAMTQEDLKTTLFPVGGMKKPEVREYLARSGLKVASKPESQDICFVSGTVADFIEHQMKEDTVEGDIVTIGGTKVGRHTGIHNFTVGQRKGLGVSDRRPLYVLDIDSETNAVKVGHKEDLKRDSFLISEVNWISGMIPVEPVTARVKLRYRHPGVRCEIQSLPNHSARLTFLDDWSPVSPGQAAVFYAEAQDSNGDSRVLGGGIISKGGNE